MRAMLILQTYIEALINISEIRPQNRQFVTQSVRRVRELKTNKFFYKK